MQIIQSGPTEQTLRQRAANQDFNNAAQYGSQVYKTIRQRAKELEEQKRYEQGLEDNKRKEFSNGKLKLSQELGREATDDEVNQFLGRRSINGEQTPNRGSIFSVLGERAQKQRNDNEVVKGNQVSQASYESAQRALPFRS